MKINRDNQGAKKTQAKFNDLGLGTKIIQSSRVINKDGTFNVTREGMNFWTPYQSLVEMSWLNFLGIVLLVFIGVNIFFGLLYFLVGLDSLAGASPSGTLLEDLVTGTFFSIQTFTTVGYGAVNPIGFMAHVIASVNALVGLMAFALVTGLIFARFAKPQAQILISKQAIIAPYEDGTSFQFRIVNKRNSKIIDLEAIVILSWIEGESNEQLRKYALLSLERTKVSLFPLNWTIVHPIDEKSPLYQKTKEELEAKGVEFIVQIKGFDETYAQTVHLNGSFLAEEMLWNVRFKMMYTYIPGRGTVLRLDEINAVEEIVP